MLDGSVQRYLGISALALGRAGDAGRHLREAVAVNEREGLLASRLGMVPLLRSARLLSSSLDGSAAGPLTRRESEIAALVAPAGLADLLDRQLAVASRGQLLALGMRDNAMQYRVRAGGPWQTLLPGVYLAASGMPSFRSGKWPRCSTPARAA
jgi:hypothetical protein